MKKIAASIVIFFCLFCYSASAQHLMVTDIQFSTSINNRKPVESDTAFAATVGTVYCYTRIEGAKDTSKIIHAWYYKDQATARIELDVNSKDWQTWSTKSILKKWTGPWRVIVEDAKGNVLATKSFTVEE